VSGSCTFSLSVRLTRPWALAAINSKTFLYAILAPRILFYALGKVSKMQIVENLIYLLKKHLKLYVLAALILFYILAKYISNNIT